ncbi:MAG TPA: MATE family efflux transporter, partial [Candidatus Sumerlaeota bacterium]|nr:MATE family efflux transporter [Candidatus Sumerlaeota bacterium]
HPKKYPENLLALFMTGFRVLSIMSKHKPGSYGEIFSIALPLVVSTGSWSIMHFTDRLFLSRWSEDALAAALPAGVLSFTFVCFFLGTVGYTSTFVAQYFGAGQEKRIGAVVWQGVWLALISGIILLPLIPLSGAIFRIIGHPDNIPELETIYFRIMCHGMIFSLLSNVFSGFFIGLGQTRIVMIVNMFTAGLNIVLDYIMIFGVAGFPAWGLQGAAWATVISTIVSAVIFFILYIQKENRQRYNAVSAIGFQPALMKRVLRFGLPNGVNFFLDISAFSFFVLLVGRLGKVELTATNIAFNVNVLAFMPMIGFAVATSTLVGQYIGRGDPEIAVTTVKRVFILTVSYMTFLALSYILMPNIFINLYGTGNDPVYLQEIRVVARGLLIFVAVYCLFDAINMVYSSAIRGAGDTAFVMRAVAVCSVTVILIPTYLCCVVFHGNIYMAWTFFSAYIVIMAGVFYWRYRGGKWKSMRVIETPPPEIVPEPGHLAESEVMR